MDRRSALAAAATLPAALAAQRAAACSIAVENEQTYAARVPELARLFRAWFQREELAFLGTVMGPRVSQGTQPDEAFVRRAIALAEDQEPKQLYHTMFVDSERYKSLVSISAVGEHAIVAVSESMPGGIGADCSNMPTLHLFMLTFVGGRPSALRLLSSGTWSGHGQTAHWSA